MTPTRPVLRYHGGKWLLAPWIIQHFPPHKIYVEPYGGAGSVLMRKEPSFAEVYNDLDDEIVGVFRVLRDPVQAAELKRLLELTPWSRTEFYACYDDTKDPIERARRVIARSYMAFGTTSRRKNRTGFRATAYRQNKPESRSWVSFPEQVHAFVARLQGVTIECLDGPRLIEQQDGPETLFYVDPPYPVSTRTSVHWDSRRDRAYIHDLVDDDHRRLAGAQRTGKGMVVLSGYACDLYDRELYSDWMRVERPHLADGARPRTEVLWLNAAAVNALQEAKAA